MSEWQPIDARPEFERQKLRQFILVEGYAEHSGVKWRRVYADTAFIDQNGPFGYRAADINRIRKDGDMDFIEGVTHWMPAIFPDLPSPPHPLSEETN